MRFSRLSIAAPALALALVILARPAAAQAPGPVRIGSLEVPAPTGYVNDFAGVIDAQSEAAIQAVIEDVRAKSGGAEIVVVTLPSLEGRPISDVSIGIARGWGIGSRGEIGDSLRNVGALLLVAPEERRVRIELSEGANNFLTAAETGRIRDRYMIPAFREGDFGTGTRLGVQALAQAFAEQYGFTLSPESRPPPVQAPVQQPQGSRGGGIPGWLILFLVFMVVSFLMNRGGGGGGPGGRRRRGFRGPIIIPCPMGGGGWGGGGFGGGGGGGGFGGFGGGGGWSGGGSEGGW